MNYSTFRFSLDLHKHESQMSIPARAGDTAIRLYISLTDGGTPYHIASGCVAVFVAKTANGRDLMHHCVIDSDSRIIYDFRESTADGEGVTDCEIRLYGSDGKLITAPRFTIVVNAQVVADEDINLGNDLSAVDAVLGASAEIRANAEAVYKRASEAETARLEAQRWANGNGTEEGDEAYQNNAKHFAEEAAASRVYVYNYQQSAETASHVAQAAQVSASNSATQAELNAQAAVQAAETLKSGVARVSAEIVDDFDLKISLENVDGKEISSITVDLPVESSVTDIDFDENSNDLIFVLRNGTRRNVPLDAVISGLINEDTLNDRLTGKVDKLTEASVLYGTNTYGTQYGYKVAEDLNGASNLKIATQKAVKDAVDALSERIKTNADAITALDAKNKEQDNAISAIAAKANENAGKITATNETVQKHEARITTLEKSGGGGGGTPDGDYVEKEDLYSKAPTGEYEDVEIAAFTIDDFSLRAGNVRGDTALVEVVPSGTYILTFKSCIEHTGMGSLYINEFTADKEQIVTDKILSFERVGTGFGASSALIASIFPNGGRCVITVGETTKYISIMFDVCTVPERLPSELTLAYKSPILGYGAIKVEKLPTKVVSNNLFNKATATTRKNVYLGKNSKGEPLYGWCCIIFDIIGTEAPADGFDSTSTAIEVEGGQTYFKSDYTIINYFDANDVWINATRPAFGATSIVTPENAKYVRISTNSSYLDKLQFINGDKSLPYDEWKMGIENFDSDNSPQINEVLARNALQYPFLQEYLWKIAEEAHKHTAPDRHTFLFISDTHAKSMSNRAMGIAANMTKYVTCSYIAHGGDIIDGISPKENELVLLTTLVRNGNEAKCPVCYAKGNHDWNAIYRSTINTSATVDEYILNSELARRTNCFIKNKVHGDVENMYFYIDDEVTKIRTIIFNGFNKDESNLASLSNGTQVFGAVQLEWLINEALNFKEVADRAEWGVIVVQHQVAGSGFWSILLGFKNGTSGTTAGADGENLSIAFDFTSQGAMNLIANFVGDNHYDDVAKVGTTPVIYILNASLANDYANTAVPTSTALKPPNKAFGTENETAFDIVTIDKANHLIYLTRYGARSYAYNSATGAYDKIAARTRVVDYLTGECIVITED